MQDVGLRVVLDRRNEKIGYKVREHSLSKVPIIAAVGLREAEEKTLAVRRIGDKRQFVMTLTDAIESLSEEGAMPRTKKRSGLTT